MKQQEAYVTGYTSKQTNLHYLDELEKQLLSVLGFLLLNNQRANPVGQRQCGVQVYDDYTV